MRFLRIFSTVSIVIISIGHVSKSHGSDSDIFGKPSWFPLGEEVYHENDLFESQKEILKFIPESRWFRSFPKKVSKAEYEEWQKKEGIQETDTRNPNIYQIPSNLPYPEKVKDLPLKDQGATLEFTIANTAKPNELVFTLSLTAGARSLKREVEHRWTNMTPFLFAFFTDGKAISKELPASGRIGGANDYWELVPPKSKREWRFKIDTKSIDSIVGSETRNLIIVAAFSERQHETYFAGDLLLEPLDMRDHIDLQIIIRSNAVRIRRTAQGWESFATKGT